MAFEKDYWEKNYSDLEEMDGVANAREHARYAKSFFDVEYIQIKSVIDLGFGMGEMLKSFTQEFSPYRIAGVEPSQYIYEKFIQKKWHQSVNARFFNIDLTAWSESKKKELKNFDLGICTSVFQYLNDEELAKILPVMSKRLRYLYFSAPTSQELKRQREELDFNDEYAIRRSKARYLSLISPHFTFVSARVLESKHFYDATSTELTDLLFRF